MVRATTLYDAAHERGLTTAQVDWVAIQNAPTITWEFRERPDAEGAGSPREMVKAGASLEADLDDVLRPGTSSSAIRSGRMRPRTSSDSIVRTCCCSTC